MKILVNNVTNDSAMAIASISPYRATVTIHGVAPLLFHRWSCDDVDSKRRAAKNSSAKRTDNLEAYVWRNDAGELCIPGEYVRQSIIHAAKFRQDPRSPRKSAMDLFKAGIFMETDLASLGTKDWDFLDRRRVVIQRNGVTRIRPAMLSGWTASVVVSVLLPEYIEPIILNEVIVNAGRLIGVGDFRPTFGRFQITNFQIL